MTREEMISKLSGIKVCAANITYTYDVGLFFDVLSSEGVLSTQGYNYSQWPCFKYFISDDFKTLVRRIKNGEDIDDNELLHNKIIKEICTIHEYGVSFVVCDETLAAFIKTIREEIKTIDDTQNSFYAYVSIENWDVKVKFFSAYEDMVLFFEDECSHLALTGWNEMSDEELEEWYNVAEENGWDGVPYMEINDEGKKHDNVFI